MPREQAQTYRSFLRGLRGAFIFLTTALVIVLCSYFYQSLVVIRSGEKGIIFRFGAPVRKNDRVVLEQGIYFAWPYPIDSYVRISTRKLYEQEVKLFLPAPGSDNRPYDLRRDGYHLCADRSIMHSRWTINYRVADLESFLFRMPAEPAERKRVLESLLARAVVLSASRLSVDDVWKNRQERFSASVETLLRSEVESLELGIAIERLDFEVIPPAGLQDDFAEVTHAAESRQKVITEAESEAQKILAQARLEAAEIISRAGQEKARLIAQSSAQKTRFDALLPQYQGNPELFKSFYFTQQLKGVMDKIDRIVLVNPRSGRELRILLDAPTGPVNKKRKVEKEP